MFKKDQNDLIRPKEAETVIGPSVHVKGNFHGQGNMVIEGTVEGSVKTGGGLQVGEKAKITASVEAKEAVVGGEIYGNIVVHGYLEITETANISGDIEAHLLSIAKGAKFNGKCNMGESEKIRNDEIKMGA